ncbi:MAG TPA: hypothetical protein PLF23_23750 [Candidatus Obscuribacter sp.]|nr:hypothetical protein [Candidatus Obscuribacter sp.]
MLPEAAHFSGLKSEPLAAASAPALGLSLQERNRGKENENILVQGKEALTGWLSDLEIDSKTVALTGAALVGAACLYRSGMVTGLLRSQSFEVLAGTGSKQLSMRSSGLASLSTHEILSGGKLTALELNRAMPSMERMIWASRTPLFDVDRAIRFGAEVRGSVRPYYGGLRKAYQPLSPWTTESALEGREGYRHLSAQVDKVVPVLQKQVNKLADEFGYPHPRLKIKWTGGEDRGAFIPGTGDLELNVRELLRPTARLPEVLFHESTHAEQSCLIVRGLADKLSIGAKASPEQMAVLKKKLAESTGTGFEDDYLKEVLQLRAGRRLTEEQLERADELAVSFARDKQKAPGYNVEKFETRVQMLKDLDAKGFHGFFQQHGPLLNSANFRRLPLSVKESVSQLNSGAELGVEAQTLAGADMRKLLANEIGAVHKIQKRNYLAYRLQLHELEAFAAGENAGGWRILSRL